MNKFIGVKIIHAMLMIHGEYALEKYGVNNAINTTEFSQQNKESEGYKVIYEDGYVSWSPKEVFEAAYRNIESLTFGLAIEAVKKGCKIARASWHDKGIFVYYVPGGTYPSQTEIAKREFGESAKYDPYLAMRMHDGSVSIYSPSTPSVLAEDWYIVGPKEEGK